MAETPPHEICEIWCGRRICEDRGCDGRFPDGAPIATASNPLVEGDWVLMPRCATPEMLAAFWRTKNTGTTEIGGKYQDSSDVAAYRAMIAAAPATDPGPVAQALEDVAATASPVQADRCRRLAAVLRGAAVGGPSRG